MADLKVAHLEHISQLLIYRVKDVNNLIAKACMANALNIR